jgi:hypothetical protein
VVAALEWPSIKPAFSLQRRLYNDFISRSPLRRVSLPYLLSRWRMIISYARVSTTEQNLGFRHDELKPALDASVDHTVEVTDARNTRDQRGEPADALGRQACPWAPFAIS